MSSVEIEWHVSNAANLLAENSRRVPQEFVPNYLRGVRDCATVGNLNGNGLKPAPYYMTGFHDSLDIFSTIRKTLAADGVTYREVKNKVYDKLDFMLSE